MAGIASYIAGDNASHIRLVGAQSSACASAPAAWEKGRPVEIDARTSLADGINVKMTGQLPFDILYQRLDQLVTVTEEEIADAMLTLLEQEKILAEGAGATPLAALLDQKITVEPNENVVLVISGGNIDMPLVGRIIDKGLMKKGRLIRLRVELPDRPGTLARLLSTIAKQEANVLHIYHERHAQGLSVNATIVELELETRSYEHIRSLLQQLRRSEYEVRTC